jgi:hypothetical protein
MMNETKSTDRGGDSLSATAERANSKTGALTALCVWTVTAAGCAPLRPLLQDTDATPW